MSLAVKLARVLLVAALLAAQQSAIAHGVWHAAGGSPDRHSGTEGSLLCDQHAALGTVLGVLGNADVAAQESAQRATVIPAPLRASVLAARLAASSRDPPSRL